MPSLAQVPELAGGARAQLRVPCGLSRSPRVPLARTLRAPPRGGRGHSCPSRKSTKTTPWQGGQLGRVRLISLPGGRQGTGFISPTEARIKGSSLRCSKRDWVCFQGGTTHCPLQATDQRCHRIARRGRGDLREGRPLATVGSGDVGQESCLAQVSPRLVFPSRKRLPWILRHKC